MIAYTVTKVFTHWRPDFVDFADIVPNGLQHSSSMGFRRVLERLHSWEIKLYLLRYLCLLSCS